MPYLSLNLLHRAENMARKAAGEEPLPEEDPSNPVFKPVPEPSRLESYLFTNQVSNYCNQINGYCIFLLFNFLKLIWFLFQPVHLFCFILN